MDEWTLYILNGCHVGVVVEAQMKNKNDLVALACQLTRKPANTQAS